MVLCLGIVLFIILMSMTSSAYTLWVCMVYSQLSVGANTFHSAIVSSIGNHITIQSTLLYLLNNLPTYLIFCAPIHKAGLFYYSESNMIFSGLIFFFFQMQSPSQPWKSWSMWRWRIGTTWDCSWTLRIMTWKPSKETTRKIRKVASETCLGDG